MIVTGRAGLVALICVLPIAASDWPAKAFVALLATLAVWARGIAPALGGQASRISPRNRR